jgi:hypothetical protein
MTKARNLATAVAISALVSMTGCQPSEIGSSGQLGGPGPLPSGPQGIPSGDTATVGRTGVMAAPSPTNAPGPTYSKPVPSLNTGY